MQQRRRRGVFCKKQAEAAPVLRPHHEMYPAVIDIRLQNSSLFFLRT
jgi:hypothetical protein